MAKHSERVTRQHHKALAAADVEHGNDHQQIPSLEGKWFAALRILSLFVDPEAPPPLSGNVEFIAKVAHSIFADSLRIHECGVYRHSGLSCVHQDVFSTDMVDEASRVLSLTCKMFRVLSMKKAALTIQVAFDTLYRYGEKRRNARFFPIGVWGKGKGYEAEKGWAHIDFDRLTEYRVCRLLPRRRRRQEQADAPHTHAILLHSEARARPAQLLLCVRRRGLPLPAAGAGRPAWPPLAQGP